MESWRHGRKWGWSVAQSNQRSARWKSHRLSVRRPVGQLQVTCCKQVGALVGVNLSPVPGLLSLGNKAGEGWWHTPCSREAPRHCQRLVTEGHERGHFDHLCCGPSKSACANEHCPYFGKSGLGENSIQKMEAVWWESPRVFWASGWMQRHYFKLCEKHPSQRYFLFLKSKGTENPDLHL